MKKSDSFVKILFSVFLVAMSLVGVAVLYKGANTSDSADLRSKAAEYKEVLVKEWEFKNGTENWSGVGTIKVDQADDALRGKLLEAYGANGHIVNSAVNEKMPQGLKYLKFRLALRAPVTGRATPDPSSCVAVMITCPDGKKQPAFTPECKPNPCPPFTPKSEADCNKFNNSSVACSSHANCQYGPVDPVCHYVPQRIVTGGIISTPCPTDVKVCPDGTKLTRVQTGNGCQFPACPPRSSPTPAAYNVVVQYAVDNQWISQTVKVVPGESYNEFSVQLPIRALTIQKIRFVIPVSAFQYVFWFDWVKLWSKVVIPPTPTNTPTPKPTATPTPTPPCLPLPSCVYIGAVDSRGTVVYCTPPPPPAGRIYCPRPTATSTPTPRPAGNCIVSGCNGELCIDENFGKGASTCVWQEKYQCYKSAKCERQSGGKCDWTQTTELKSCLSRYPTPTVCMSNVTSPYEAECSPIRSSGACMSNPHCTWVETALYCAGNMPPGTTTSPGNCQPPIRINNQNGSQPQQFGPQSQ